FGKLKIRHWNSYVLLLQERAEAYAYLGEQQLALKDSNEQVVLTQELKHPLPILLAASYRRHAGILERFGQYAEAVDFYRQALNINDANYDQPTLLLFQILHGLENSLRSLGQDDEALAIQKRLSDLQPATD